ncbi:hypothetical protein LSTR_LSTR010694 [Laodelphax striatellus]|uniref:Uncharacterized protein n=1 Tax=Laodelphax striatellus TaxID=195883 RepID=A0A482WSW0_LAOST|nr:hypothetical protein LSTR_LSTR010694 [Laodelphax striatellus]
MHGVIVTPDTVTQLTATRRRCNGGAGCATESERTCANFSLVFVFCVCLRKECIICSPLPSRVYPLECLAVPIRQTVAALEACPPPSPPPESLARSEPNLTNPVQSSIGRPSGSMPHTCVIVEEQKTIPFLVN